MAHNTVVDTFFLFGKIPNHLTVSITNKVKLEIPDDLQIKEWSKDSDPFYLTGTDINGVKVSVKTTCGRVREWIEANRLSPEEL